MPRLPSCVCIAATLRAIMPAPHSATSVFDGASFGTSPCRDSRRCSVLRSLGVGGVSWDPGPVNWSPVATR
jgi:hypothetical protein